MNVVNKLTNVLPDIPSYFHFMHFYFIYSVKKWFDSNCYWIPPCYGVISEKVSGFCGIHSGRRYLIQHISSIHLSFLKYPNVLRYFTINGVEAAVMAILTGPKTRKIKSNNYIPITSSYTYFFIPTFINSISNDKSTGSSCWTWI